MKDLVNFTLDEYFYSFVQEINRNGETIVENNPYKIVIKLGDTYKDYRIDVFDIVEGFLIETINSQTIERDDDLKTCFYGKNNNRQVVIVWESKLQLGLAKTNIRGFDLLLNIFQDDAEDLLEPSLDNLLEFLRSSAPFIIQQGYNRIDLWGRMRYIAIQYILHEFPQNAHDITFANSIEKRFRPDEDLDDSFQSDVIESMEIISSESDRCAREAFIAKQNRDIRRYDTYRQNVAILSAIYNTGLHLLGYTDFMD